VQILPPGASETNLNSIMDHDATRPLSETRKVVYRCDCGCDLTVPVSQSGRCDQCGNIIPPQSAKDEPGNTVPIDEQSFEINQTQPGIQLGTQPSVPKVILTDSPPEPKSLVGHQLGHFEIIQPLGHGGMGQVYRATDTSLKRQVAVKVLRRWSAQQQLNSGSAAEIDKLLQEAISQARVEHPNVVTIYYVGKENGSPFLAMELIHGSTLNRRIENGDLTFSETARIGLEVASALRASFNLDIIHGDIKPSNILMTADGVAKLSDFGMARRASQKQTVAEGGTPNYLAPELFKGQNVSAQSDMYALGVTLYEMTFGQLPLEMKGTSIDDWIAIHESQTIDFPNTWPPQVPEFWRTVLSKMLAGNPAERYENYDQLIEDLEKIQPHSSVAARFFPRLIAAGIDWAIVLLVTIGFQTALLLLSQQRNQSGSLAWLGNQLAESVSAPAWWPYLVGGTAFLPIIAYTFGVYFWRQSIGRKLMHLKVINQYGLRPSPRKMAVRSLLRMHFPWIVIFLTSVIGTPNELFGYIVYIISGIVLLADIMVMLFSLRGTSLHDIAARTRVVLDTEQNQD
jgi:serine/threonine protein kinase